MGDKYLSHKEIKKTIKQIEKLNIPLTVFECLTLIYVINAAKINADYNIQETGALWRLDSNNINDFPRLQICTNINKQHLNFLKRKTLDEVIREDVGFLSNFTNIYIGKQTPYVLRKIKTLLKSNKSKIIYPSTWKLIKKGNYYYYQDRKFKIKLNTKNVYSKGMFENVCLAIKVALDLKIDKKVIQKALPFLSFEGRFQYLNKGKIKNKLNRNESIMIDGAHATADAQNLASYLKKIKVPKYGIWAMTKNKDPDLFIKQLKGIFKKIITIPIENEISSVSAQELFKVATENKFNVEKSDNFAQALKKISSKEKKLIVCFGSLYNCGNILNKN
jgi:folylpolyglutamate synthase/dihydropteroate synthase